MLKGGSTVRRLTSLYEFGRVGFLFLHAPLFETGAQAVSSVRGLDDSGGPATARDLGLVLPPGLVPSNHC